MKARYLNPLIIKIFLNGGKVVLGSDLEFKDNVEFGRNAFITAIGGKIFVGENTKFNQDVILNADIGGQIFIGRNCLIGPRCVFRTANHNFKNLSVLIRDQGHNFKDIIIGENVWLGAGVIVLGGVRIGAGAIVGAGAVVTKDLDPNSVSAGVPARTIRFR